MSQNKRKQSRKPNIWQTVASVVVILFMIGFGYVTKQVELPNTTNDLQNRVQIQTSASDLESIPEYTGNPYIEINGNMPYFTKEEETTKSFESYSRLDKLGRSGVAFANVCKETMPKEGEERGEIGSIKDLSGWVQKRYDDKIKDKYLYNRCHLIGWQLSRRKCKQTKSNNRNEIPKYTRNVAI